MQTGLPIFWFLQGRLTGGLLEFFNSTLCNGLQWALMDGQSQSIFLFYWLRFGLLSQSLWQKEQLYCVLHTNKEKTANNCCFFNSICLLDSLNEIKNQPKRLIVWQGWKGRRVKKSCQWQVFSQSRGATCCGLADRLEPWFDSLNEIKNQPKRLIAWQGWKESNPPLEFWRLSFYR